MSERTIPYGLGESAVAGELDHLLGYRAYFQDVAAGSGTGAVTENSGHVVEAIWVKNDDTVALTPGLGLIWDTAADIGKDVKKAGDDVMWAGIASHKLPATGAAVGENFWMIVKGPTQVQHDGDATGVVKGDLIVAGDAGQAKEYNATPTSDALTLKEATYIVGRCTATPSAETAGSLISIIADLRGI